MGWEVVRREDKFEGHDRPFISISPSHIAFNATFTRIAELDSGYRVTIHADPVTRRLGFDFHRDERPNSFAVFLASSDKKGKKRKGVSCTALSVVSQYPWVRSVTKLPIKERRFYEPRKEGVMWVIRLCPAFEDRRARESADIPSDVRGIYRYVRESGEVVYIGRGDVKKRLASPERRDWDFDIVEYSPIETPDEQVYWEEYWIEKFKEANGRRPFYNKVSGFSKEAERKRQTEES